MHRKERQTFIQTGFCLLMFFLCFCAHSNAQTHDKGNDKQVTLSCKATPLSMALSSIERQSSYYKLVYNYEELSKFQVTVEIKKKSMIDAVQMLLQSVPYQSKVDGKFIVISKKAEASRQQMRQPVKSGAPVTIIRGQVRDEDNNPIPGVSVVFHDHAYGVTTDPDGKYELTIEKGCKDVIWFTFVGMETEMVSVNCNSDEKLVNVVLKETSTNLNDVVVTGMFNRRKESFTGSSTTFTKDELFNVGNQNLLKSIANLDPSFQLVDNLATGSDPNSMPNYQMRGQTSFNIKGDYDGNTNQPLFILDGFETTLEKVNDLDMNRVESITLLKDAAAKAIYGSKAGNGVVVIVTKRPKSGKLRVSYDGNLNMEVPDLSDYNLMNAQEKFQWEIDHHKYDNWQIMIGGAQAADDLYKSVYDAIASGVDTYWLSKPLHTGIGQKHTVTLEGGDSKVRYILGASYNNIAGVMKGSDRNTFNINSSLSYSYKNMVFRNQMDYTRNTSKNSPYGSFSDYITLEPYFAPYDSEGNLKQILGYQTATNSYPVYNPLYNASLNTKDESNYTTFADNFEMDWHIDQHFRFTANMSYSRQENGSDVFYPASHSMFAEYSAANADRKGRYTKTNGAVDNFNLQAGINWNQSFGKHAFFLNGTWNLQTVSSNATTVVAEGFGNDAMNDISMGTYYYHDSHPTGYDNKTREIGLVGAFNYSYDDRYLLDANYRATGSSVYGSDNHWGSFWSLGAGWNIHKEHFFPRNSIVKLLKLRYSLGYTGTQNFNPYQARAKYQYGSQYYDGRLGTTIMGIPNTSLKWQKVFDSNLGLDISLGSFLTGRLEYYEQDTNNMLTDITLPGSTGFQTYKENMGEIQNKGVELALGFTPWRDNSTRSWLTFTFSAAHNKNKIKKIYDIFKKSNNDADKTLNQQQPDYSSTVADNLAWRTQTTRPVTKYYEGCSMTAIWGVRSLGIDPMSGKEMFLDKNDNVTYTWSSDDQVVIGDTNPNWHGIIGISGGWKGFTFAMTASYKMGGDLYNTTLIDRVENVNGFGNLDKRVSQTWLNVGDNALYKYIDMEQTPTTINVTKPTSRFVQRNNELYFSSINIGYDFFREAWIKSLGLEQLKFTFYMNELARLSTVRIERGTSYPFARTFSFTVNATF